MRGDSIWWAEAGALVDAVRDRHLTASDVVEAVLARIRAVDHSIGAFVTVCEQEARETARAADAKRRKGETLGHLDGVPVSVKDIILTKGVRTTAGSKLHAEVVPATDAIVVERLKAAGAILMGKTATPEFCHKTITDSPLAGVTRNPWDLERTPGGSSGGSAAAVAAGMGPISIGTDGGGSIRLPAALCGVVGFKPSFGLVPQWPVIPGWDLLGHTGPLARSVTDIERVMMVIAGPDARDPVSLRSWPKPRKGKPRIAWAPTLDDLDPEPSVAAALADVVACSRRIAGHVEEVQLRWDDPDQQFRVIVLSDLDGAFGHYLDSETESRLMDPTLKQMLQFGQTLRGRDLARALRWKNAFSSHILSWFEDFDILIVPTTPVTAFPLGSMGPRMISGRKTSPHAWFGWTWPFNVTGQPSLSLPIVRAGSLPAGIQIVGRIGEDARVLAFARKLERRLSPSGIPHPQL